MLSDSKFFLQTVSNDCLIAGMNTTLNQDQRALLQYMDDMNLSVFFSDAKQRWVWREDIRRDTAIAKTLVAEKLNVIKAKLTL